jgi:hypothetical protein
MKFPWTLPALALAVCVPTARADDQAEMKALLTKAITAHGGADNLKKNAGATTRSTAKLTAMGQTFDLALTTNFQDPDKIRVDINLEVSGQKLNILQVINGDKGWYVLNGNTMEFTKEQQDQVKESLERNRLIRLTPLLDKAYTLSPLGEIKVDAKPALGLRAERKDFPGANLYFDKESGRLVKCEMQMANPGDPSQQINGELFLSDYRKVEGVMFPHKVVLKSDGKTILESETTEVTLVPKLDDNLFGKP